MKTFKKQKHPAFTAEWSDTVKRKGQATNMRKQFSATHPELTAVILSVEIRFNTGIWSPHERRTNQKYIPTAKERSPAQISYSVLISWLIYTYIYTLVWFICKQMNEPGHLPTLVFRTTHGGCAAMQVLPQLHHLRSTYTQLLPETHKHHKCHGAPIFRWVWISGWSQAAHQKHHGLGGTPIQTQLQIRDGSITIMNTFTIVLL